MGEICRRRCQNLPHRPPHRSVSDARGSKNEHDAEVQTGTPGNARSGSRSLPTATCRRAILSCNFTTDNATRSTAGGFVERYRLFRGGRHRPGTNRAGVGSCRTSSHPHCRGFRVGTQPDRIFSAPGTRTDFEFGTGFSGGGQSAQHPRKCGIARRSRAEVSHHFYHARSLVAHGALCLRGFLRQVYSLMRSHLSDIRSISRLSTG